MELVTVHCAAQDCGATLKIDGSNWSNDFIVYCHDHAAT